MYRSRKQISFKAMVARLFASCIGLTCLFMLLAGMSFNAHAQADAGPDTTICLGESVTIGTPGNSSFCYKWDPETGLSDPTSAQPTANPSTETTYTLVVTGEDFSFTDQDQVVVTPVGINDITFSEPSLPNDGESQATATADVQPPGESINWTIEENNAPGTIIDQTTGVITAGMTAGEILVRATPVNDNTECYDEKEYCIGEDCCPEQQGTKTFGPVSVSLPSGIQTGGQDSDGYCSYSTQASVSIAMEGIFQKSASLPGVEVSWKEKADNPGDFKDVTISWSGNHDMGNFGVIHAVLTNASLTVNASGQLSGDVTFAVDQNRDVPLGGIAVMKSGVSGNFTYSYNSANSFVGTWDFDQIVGFEVHLLKNGRTIGRITAESFDSQGNINNARFTAETPAFYTSSSFSVELVELDLGMNYNIADGAITFLGGTGAVRVFDMQNVDGEFSLSLVFTSSSVNATVVLDAVTAFGCTVNGTMEANFDFNFDFSSIEGSNISAQHNDFDQAFTGVNFEVQSGRLEAFSIGRISVKYQGKIEFTMSNAAYSRSQSSLVFDANVVLPTIQMEVTDFRISTGSGAVSVGSITAEINRSPVYLFVNVAFQSSPDFVFSGSFNGQFAGNVGINGSVLIGATGSFNYGHFTLGVTVPGIPLGSSGLKIKTLSGEFGFNFNASATQGGSGSPQQGTYTIGFGLGLSDVANLVLLEGYVRLTLGSANSIDLEGAVKVTANAPHYLQGNMTISYVLGSFNISGTINSTVKIPPGNGAMVNLNSGNIAFGINTNGWFINGSGMDGTILSAIDVESSVNLGSPLNNIISGMRGTMHGSLSYDNNFTFEWPPGFNPSSCATAEATDRFGFGVEGNLQVHLGGSLNVNLNGSGVAGAINVSASGSSSLAVKWPCWFTCGYNCVDNYFCALSGSLTVERTSSFTRLHGNARISAGSESEEIEIDFAL